VVYVSAPAGKTASVPLLPAGFLSRTCTVRTSAASW
jgi:hypothetical protein